MKKNKIQYSISGGILTEELFKPMSEAEQKQLDEEMIDKFYNLAKGGFFYLLVTQEEADRLSQDEEERKRRFAESMFKVFVAATHFVNVSPSAWEISQLVQTTPEEVINWSKTPLWHCMLKRLGFKGDSTPQFYEPKSRIPKYLREDYLILQAFQKNCPVRFITYNGFTDARVKQVKKYEFILAPEDRGLKKHDVILAFPQDRMEYVKNGIQVNKEIAAKNLRPVPRRSDRPDVEVGARRGAIVECLMQNGLVVTGENLWISKYNIVMRVGGEKAKGGKVILVYRHALLQFRVINSPHETSQTSDTFDDISETGAPYEPHYTMDDIRRVVSQRNRESRSILPWGGDTDEGNDG